MKLNKNIVIPISLLVGVGILEIIVNSMPVMLVVLVLIFTIPIPVILAKTNNDWGKIFLFGLLLALMLILTVIGLTDLTNHSQWFEKVFFWSFGEKHI